MGFFYISDDMTAEETEFDDDVVVLVVGGELDFAASPRLRECVAGYVKAGRLRLVLDLSTVTFIDSTAIGVLVGADTKLREAGKGSLAVVCPRDNEPVSGIFEIAGIESLIDVFGSREEALSALAAAG